VEAGWTNLDEAVLDRVEATLAPLGLPVRRVPGSITGGEAALSHLLDWLGAARDSAHQRVPPMVLSWPRPLIEAFLAGASGSKALAGDMLLLAQRLGHHEHEALTAVPLPDILLQHLRAEAGLSHVDAAPPAGHRDASDLSNVERRYGRDTVRRSTLRRLRDSFRAAAPEAPSLRSLDRLVDGDLMFDVVQEVIDTGVTEPIFDLEVRPGGAKIENFLAGSGGVLVSNTAGFVDAGFDGHLTLELSNVLNLPIKLYPGMKIGQISFLRTTTPVDMPYGSQALGSKYQGQRGPTPSRYWENFRGE
jgi:hypothetical protein